MAVQKIVATNKATRDELYNTEMFAHKSCYCKYTSKSRNNEQKKGKDALAHTFVSKKRLKSQCSDFVFKRDCMLCGNVCKMKDRKNPHRWVEIRHCKTVNRGSGNSWRTSTMTEMTSGGMR